MFYGLMIADNMVNKIKIRLYSDALDAVKVLDEHENNPGVHNLKTCITDLVEQSNMDPRALWNRRKRDSGQTRKTGSYTKRSRYTAAGLSERKQR